MKKFLPTPLTIAFTLALSACGGSSGGENDTASVGSGNGNSSQAQTIILEALQNNVA